MVTDHQAAGAGRSASLETPRKRFRTWPVVAVSLVGLLGLIVVSILAVQRKADTAYAHLDSLNAHYRDVELRLRRVRSDVHLSGILVRDYLLDTVTPSTEYRTRLLAYRTESDRMINELGPLLSASDPKGFDRLRNELSQYWGSYALLFDETTLVVDRYTFLRREIVPRRDAVMNISAEIEELNNRNLRAQQLAAADRQFELHQYLTRTLSVSLALGLVVAIVAVIRIRLLEGRSEEEHVRTHRAEQELRRLSNQLVRTQEEERKHLSRELHDELGQMLTALRMEIGRSERAQVGGTAFAATTHESKALIDRMMQMVRDLAMGLRPSMLDDLGLEPALAWQAREFSRRYNVPVDLSVDGDLERLPDPQRTCVYRVVQEALTNCAKHSAATEIQVQVVRGRSRLDVSVRDNGVGMSPVVEHNGLGLTGIKERVKDINGSTSIQTKPGGGTVVHITLPVPATENTKENLVANSAR